MKKSTVTILALVLSAMLFTACSKDEESVTEKVSNKIDEINTKNADAMVKKIKTPIDKARATKDLGNKRVEEMDKALSEQQ